jgi:hypothetical protein
MAQTVDFMVYDLVLVAQKQGLGMNLSYSAVPDVKLREYWSGDQREQLSQAVASFFQLGEASLIEPMAYNDWNQLLYDCGFDLQNMQWPGGQSPMGLGGARRSIGAGVVAPPLPMAPSMGVLPPVPGMPPIPQQGLPVHQLAPQGVVGSSSSPIMQPVFAASASPFGAVSQNPAPPAPQFQAPVTPMPIPAQPTPAQPTPAQSVVANPVFVQPAGVQPVQHTSGYISREEPYAPSLGQVVLGQTVGASGGLLSVDTGSNPTASVQVEPSRVDALVSGVPLGTPPVIPQTFAGPPEAPVFAGPAPSVNTVPDQQEISMEEMDQLLS